LSGTALDKIALKVFCPPQLPSIEICEKTSLKLIKKLLGLEIAARAQKRSLPASQEQAQYRRHLGN